MVGPAVRIGNRNHPLRTPTTEPEVIVAFLEPDARGVLRYHDAALGDDRLDAIALEVAKLPPRLTIGQRARARVVARELARRARRA